MSRTESTARLPIGRAPLTSLATLLAILGCLLVHVSSAHAMMLLGPTDQAFAGAANTTPLVAFDPASGEKPTYVMLAMTQAMTSPVRYCRQWQSVTLPNMSGVHYGCNAWAIGTDANGNDTVEKLVPGKTYFWQVEYTDSSGASQVSGVRSFTVSDDPATTAADAAQADVFDPDAIMAKIDANVYGSKDGTNKGSAASVNSKVSSVTLKVRQIKPNRFTLDVAYSGAVVPKQSYVRINGTAGSVDIIKLRTNGSGHLKGVWIRTSLEQRVKSPTYKLQAWVRSMTNASLVRSAVSKMSLDAPKKKHAKAERTIII